MYGEIICAGNHLTTIALYNFFNYKVSDYCIIIIDALLAKGYEPGSRFTLGENSALIMTLINALLILQSD